MSTCGTYFSFADVLDRLAPSETQFRRDTNPTLDVHPPRLFCIQKRSIHGSKRLTRTLQKRLADLVEVRMYSGLTPEALALQKVASHKAPLIAYKALSTE